MKKIFVLALVILLSIPSFAQHPLCRFVTEQRHLAKQKIDIRLSRLPLSFALPFMDKEARQWLLKTSFIHLVVFEGVEDSGKMYSAFNGLTAKLENKNYEPLVTISDNGDKVNILGKNDRNDNIREIVLMVNDKDNDVVLIRLKGKFKMSDIDKIQRDVAKNNLVKSNQN